MTAGSDHDDEATEWEADAVIAAPQLRGTEIPPEVARARQIGRLAILDQPVISAEEAFRLLRIDRSTGYKAIREGTFPLPILRIGRVIRIPSAALARLLNPDAGGESTDESEEPL